MHDEPPQAGPPHTTAAGTNVEWAQDLVIGTSESPVSPAESMARVIRSYRPSDRLPGRTAELLRLRDSLLPGQGALLPAGVTH